jgi:hypothetical protein
MWKSVAFFRQNSIVVAFAATGDRHLLRSRHDQFSIKMQMFIEATAPIACAIQENFPESLLKKFRLT